MTDDNSRYIDINRYYHCIINGREELCKITRHCIEDQTTGVKVFCYRVDCFYYGKELFTGTLSECRKWLLFRVTLSTLHQIRREKSHYEG